MPMATESCAEPLVVPIPSRSAPSRYIECLFCSHHTEMLTVTQVFISYVLDDCAMVQRLAQTLELYRIKVWLDRNSLKPGYRWKKAIRDGIREGDFFIACFSRAPEATGAVMEVTKWLKP